MAAIMSSNCARKWRSSRAIFALLLLLALSPRVAQAAETVSLTIKSGAVKGLRSDGIAAYKGIPYARPPSGELRFAPPRDVIPWAGERDCTKFGPIAFQDSNSIDPANMSEDCLTLNVWTPSKPGEAAKLPVYVFIHGGGFATGTGSMDWTAGFAKSGIVVVTLNYRLNVAGFFASWDTYEKYGTTGNWGILDQIEALEWVRDNIALFGGDPGRVTIGGQSAGSYSVSALLLSPLAKGLFRGAIMESGSILGLAALSGFAKGDLQRAVEASAMLGHIFGLMDDAGRTDRMREIDAYALANYARFVEDKDFAGKIMPMPVFDGRTIPLNPAEALAGGDVRRVNLLVGFTRDECAASIPEHITVDEYAKIAFDIFGSERITAVLKRFPVDEHNSPARRAREVLAYSMFTAGAKAFADAIAANRGDVYMYVFDYNDAKHGDELPYVFRATASVAKLTAKQLSPQDALLEGEMHTRWANFIKNGNPNVGEKPKSEVMWPKYDSKLARVIHFDRNITSGVLPNREDIDFIIGLLH
jgi:para-nitrobenzyl esterase